MGARRSVAEFIHARRLASLDAVGRYDSRTMTEDDAPKSSFELAMARLRKKDAASGDSIRELSEG